MTEQKLTDPCCNFQYPEVKVRYSARPLVLYRYVGPPHLIFNCIGFNVMKTSKEKQKVILQLLLLQLMLCCNEVNK